MKHGLFIIGTDGSQEGDKKYFPMVIRVLDSCNIQLKLLANPTRSEQLATQEEIYKALDTALSKYDVPWENWLADTWESLPLCTRRMQVHLAGWQYNMLSIAPEKATKQFQLL